MGHNNEIVIKRFYLGGVGLLLVESIARSGRGKIPLL
jgi:tRNA A37 threonylcarbamoyladenosine dehydratase